MTDQEIIDAWDNELKDGSLIAWTTNPYEALHFVDKRSAELAARNLFVNGNIRPRVACHSFAPIMENA